MYVINKNKDLSENLEAAHTFYVEAVATRVQTYGMGLLAAIVFIKGSGTDYEREWAIAIWLAAAILVVDLLQYVIGGQIIYHLRDRLYTKKENDLVVQSIYEQLQKRLRKFYYAKLIFLGISALFVGWLAL